MNTQTDQTEAEIQASKERRARIIEKAERKQALIIEGAEQAKQAKFLQIQRGKGRNGKSMSQKMIQRHAFA